MTLGCPPVFFLLLHFPKGRLFIVAGTVVFLSLELSTPSFPFLYISRDARDASFSPRTNNGIDGGAKALSLG